MRFKISLSLAVIIALMAVIGCSKTLPGINWAENLEAGKERAKTEEKPLMVYYSADWDELSEDFEKDVLADSEIRTALDKIVAVHLDSDVDEETAKEYGVSAFPTVIFYTHTGDEVKRVVGYVEAEEFKQTLNDVIEGKLETFKEMLAREENNPDDLQLRYEVAEYYLESTRIEKAASRFRSIIADDPENTTELVPSSMIYLGFCNMINNDPDGAIGIYEEIIEKYPDSDEERKAKLYIGDCYRIKDDIDMALEQYKMVASTYPDTEEGEIADQNVAEMEAFEKTIDSLFSRDTGDDK
jgi:thioredoxin-related protein